MGRYINQIPKGIGFENLPALGKVQKLLTIEGAELINEPKEWEEDIVCVVNNGPFEAAAYAFDERELRDFSYPDGRPKKWLKIPGADKLAK